MEAENNAWTVFSDKEGVDWDRSWHWIAKGDMKGCTEALICSA